MEDQLKAPFPLKASGDFKLSITRALGDQLSEKLGELVPAPLTAEQLDGLEKRQGVYQLFVEGQLVYVGKAAQKGGLPARLRGHMRKLSGRRNINMRDVGYVCLYVDEDLDAAAPEKLLIKRYKANGEAPWNTMGFGNKDPGRNRDKTLVKAQHFDAEYPINTDLAVEGLQAGEWLLGPVLMTVKENLPYTFRFPTVGSGRKPRRDLREVPILVPDSVNLGTGLSITVFLELVLAVLPEGWQATTLPGYVILYDEWQELGSATRYWRKVDGLVKSFEGKGLFDENGQVDDNSDEGDD
ncbi:hypothetical protein ACWCW7_32255 [Nocardia tengchongensis]